MKNKIAFQVAALASVVFLLCILTASAVDKKAGPQQKEFSSDFATVWTATIGVLQGNGDAVVHSDKENGIISTDYKAEGNGKWRHKFNLLLTKKDEQHTTVSVTAVIENLSRGAFTAQRWQDQKSDGKREAQLLEEITKQLGSQTAK